TFSPLAATPQYLRAYMSDPRDLGRTILFQGKDQNGQTIRFIDPLTQSAGLGETVVLDSPFATSANQFSEVSGVQKQKTWSEVQVFQVDAAGLETPLLTMQPGETTALYRKYFINGLPCGCCNAADGSVQVLAMVKLDFQPVAADSDYLSILSIPALIDEVQAIRLSRMETPVAVQLSQAKHTSALRILFGQLQNYLGNERPALTRHLWGSDRLRIQPI